MASKFLDDLKNAVEKGDFNSEAAKKINDIDKLADEKKGSTPTLDKIYDDVNTGKIVVNKPTDEEVEVINAEYEKTMKEIKEKDLVLQQIKTLQEIDETIMLSVGDMRDFVQTLDESFDKDNPLHKDLFAEMERIKNKYSSIINN